MAQKKQVARSSRSVEDAFERMRRREDAILLEGIYLADDADATARVITDAETMIEFDASAVIERASIGQYVDRVWLARDTLVSRVQRLPAWKVGASSALRASSIPANGTEVCPYSDDGWLAVKPDAGGSNVSLPSFLKVKFTGRANGRDGLTVLEGALAGLKASVRAKSETESYLRSLPTYLPPVRAKFSRGAETLFIGSKSYRAISNSKPIANGIHPIQIPDFPHDIAKHYVTPTNPYAMSWFYLGQGNAVPGNNANYLHCGSISEGCVTVKELDRWTEVYNELILRREGAGNVGTIEVVD